VFRLFRYQRAIRTFTDEAVPDELVHQVLTAAIHGPSGSDTQPWHLIVVRDPTVKQAISEVYEEARAPGRAGFPTGASIDPGVQHLLLAARALALGSCLTTLHRRRRRASTRSSASPPRSRARRSSRSAGPTGTTARTGGARWPSL
jgi:nitroreductase